MKRNDKTQKIMDLVLRELVTFGVIGAEIALPNLMKALEKPLFKYYSKLDKRERERQTRKVIYYMKSRGLLRGEYEFGIVITKKGQKALEKLDFENIKIANPNKWDGRWRIVFYDIPEKHKSGRDALITKLKHLGFHQLQRSVWIHPFPCRDIIEKVTFNFKIQRFVSYVEATGIDNQKILISRFKKYFPKVKF